jgi:hypothetical protein
MANAAQSLFEDVSVLEVLPDYGLALVSEAQIEMVEQERTIGIGGLKRVASAIVSMTYQTGP